MSKFPFLFNLQRFGEGDPPADPPATPPATPPADPQVFSKEYVQSLRGEAAGYRSELREAQKALASVKKAMGLKEADAVDDYGKLVDGFKVEQAKAGEAAVGKAKQLLLKAEVKSQAATLGVVDPDAAFALADLSKVTTDDDGKVTGVKEALEALLTAKPYLKGTSAGPGPGTHPGDTSTNPNPWKKETFNLTKQAEILRKDAALAERLKAEAKGK